MRGKQAIQLSRAAGIWSGSSGECDCRPSAFTGLALDVVENDRKRAEMRAPLRGIKIEPGSRQIKLPAAAEHETK